MVSDLEVKLSGWQSIAPEGYPLLSKSYVPLGGLADILKVWSLGRGLSITDPDYKGNVVRISLR